jgi:Tol biopolymer transport system component
MIIVGALLFWIATHRNLRPPELKQLTFEPALALMPAVSPDGKLLAYVADHNGDGHADLWLKQISGGEALRRTVGPGAVSMPQFSPDGTTIYYLASGSIYSIPTLGGSARKVMDDAGPFSISTRGEIAFARIGTGGAFGRINTTSSDGTATELWQPQCFSDGAPAWSPNGEQILIVGSCGGDSPVANLGVYVGAAHGGSLQRLNLLPPETIRRDLASLQRISWFRLGNGAEGLILSLRSGDSQNLFRVGFDGKIEPLTQGTGLEAWPVVTTEGDVIFARSEITSTIWSLPLVDNSGESPRREAAPGTMFSVSRDGSKLVFGRMAGADHGQFVLLDRTGGAESVLATHEVATGGVGSFWSQLTPDGTKAIYRVVGKEAGEYVVSTAGGGTRRLTQPGGGFGLASDWSVDGERILGECLPSQEGICEVDYNTGSVKKVVKDSGAELLYPSWSWDEKWITFMRRRGGQTGIWVAPMNGPVPGPEAQWTRISPQGGTGSRSRFALDGESVFYLLDQNGSRFLVKQPLNFQKAPLGAPTEGRLNPLQLGIDNRQLDDSGSVEGPGVFQHTRGPWKYLAEIDAIVEFYLEIWIGD